MTHDKYKAALEELMACKLTEYPTLLAKFINEHYETTRSALRLAQEAEQLRKRLAELENSLAQANNKIQWYERTEATND